MTNRTFSFQVMEYPIAATEQYARGLGATIDELSSLREHVLSDKTQFSMMTPEVNAFMDENKVDLSLTLFFQISKLADRCLPLRH